MAKIHRKNSNELNARTQIKIMQSKIKQSRAADQQGVFWITNPDGNWLRLTAKTPGSELVARDG